MTTPATLARDPALNIGTLVLNGPNEKKDKSAKKGRGRGPRDLGEEHRERINRGGR